MVPKVGLVRAKSHPLLLQYHSTTPVDLNECPNTVHSMANFVRRNPLALLSSS